MSENRQWGMLPLRQTHKATLTSDSESIGHRLQNHVSCLKREKEKLENFSWDVETKKVTLKKKQVEILQLKKTITIIKNLMHSLTFQKI